jgi:hypothetical protein
VVTKVREGAWNEDSKQLFAAEQNDDGDDIQFPVIISFDLGDYNQTGNWESIDATNVYRKALIEIKFGGVPEKTLSCFAELPPDEDYGLTLETCLHHNLFRDQVLDYLAIIYGCNCSVQDHDFLSKANNRWADNEHATEHNIERFTSRLSPHSLGCVAALNLPAVGNNARLAWTRAYALSCGLLPSEASIHGIEYCFTDALPSNQELEHVYAYHVPGQEAKKYMRGCLSLVAAFGALHLANDHTYKEREESLKRKGVAMIRACRTTLEEDEAEDLISEDLLRHSTRTAVHPFGLSSSWGTFKCGQRLSFLSEPLVIRDSVVPPMLQSVSIVVDEANKIFSLPIGGKFLKTYGKAFDALQDAKKTMIQNATEYSVLHKHYGHNEQKKMTEEQDAHVKLLTPIVAAYCRVFSLDADGNPVGASLSWVLKNAELRNQSHVDLYANAFEKYADDGATLDDLLGISDKKESSSKTE